MNFPQIRTEQTPAKIEIRTQRGRLEIEQPKPVLEIEQPPAEMNIERTPSKLTIDQTKAREDMDLKQLSKLIEDAAARGKQDVLEGIARRSQEGDELMMIENGGNPIADQAERNAHDPMYDFNIGWIPSAGGVQIQYDPGKVDINWKINRPIIHSKINKPIISFTPGKVDISLKQYNSLKIDFENLKHVGIKYEQSI